MKTVKCYLFFFFILAIRSQSRVSFPGHAAQGMEAAAAGKHMWKVWGVFVHHNQNQHTY